MDEEFLGRAAGAGAENAAEIAAVDAADVRNIFNGNIVLEVLLDKIDGFFYVIITHFAAGNRSLRPCRLGEIIQKKV